MNREDLQNEEKNCISFINSNNGMRYVCSSYSRGGSRTTQSQLVSHRLVLNLTGVQLTQNP